ncbi:hypothetical protein R1sor_018979 [Riccia sorocarpa]|uniref:Zinc-finger domain-containing protein n=1 Tax=Riccia sorocarpa TaxID=122646 RepID=A0ABD3IDZ3_9MARC
MAVKRKVEDDSIHSLPSRSPGTAKKNRVNAEMEEVGDKSDAAGETMKGGADPQEVEAEEGQKAAQKPEATEIGVPTSNSDDEDSEEEERLEYEKERNRILDENRKRMQELGLSNLSQHLSPAYRTKVNMKSGLQAVQKNKQKKEAALQAGFVPRRSARREGRKAPDYKDLFKVKEEPQEVKTRQRREVKSISVRKPDEAYTEEHINSLGSYTEEWTLFQDGYSADGVRIYDPVQGKTCHQCRQKTMGRRTWCNSCNMLAGQFCGDCLFMRYGENVLEANANPNWACPGCRGICNCSICRMRKGWAPTGNMYRYAISEGYRSVAHYLVMTRQRKHELVKAGDGTETQPECEKGEEKVVLLLEGVKEEREETGQPDSAQEKDEAKCQPECRKLEPDGTGPLECVTVAREETVSVNAVLVEPGDDEPIFLKGIDRLVQSDEENQRTKSEPEWKEADQPSQPGDNNDPIFVNGIDRHIQSVEENERTKSEPEGEQKDQLSKCPVDCEIGGDGPKAEVMSLDTSDQKQDAKDDEKGTAGRSKVSGRAAVRKLSTSLPCGAETVSARLRRKEIISYKRFL